MMKKIGMALLLFWQFSILFAAQQKATSLGTMADNMMGPVNLFEQFINTACYVLGGLFIFTSLIKYVEHRRSPLMVPISTVIFLLLAGLLLICLPLLQYIH